MKHWILYLLIALPTFTANAFDLKVEAVSERAYAIVGHIGPRTPENHALNNTLGFVVTDAGVVLVGSGTTPTGAKLVEDAVARVTDKPIVLVVNIGTQDHHWLGNSHFAGQGIPIKALQRTADGHRRHLPQQLQRLRQQLGEETETITAVYADDVVDANRQVFTVGDIEFQLIWPGGGHYGSDAVLWLPESRTLFSGDYVFHDRLLGIHPTTPVNKWQHSFHEIAALEPLHVVPGHGHPGNLLKAKRETGDYLDWVVSEVGKALEDWQELGDTIAQLADAPAFSRLAFFDSWHKRNLHQTYMQLEAGLSETSD